MLGYNAEMCLRHVSWVSPVSLDFPFLTIHSVFSNVYVPMRNNNTTPLKHKLN